MNNEELRTIDTEKIFFLKNWFNGKGRIRMNIRSNKQDFPLTNITFMVLVEQEKSNKNFSFRVYNNIEKPLGDILR